jgi:predicted ester cyclase
VSLILGSECRPSVVVGWIRIPSLSMMLVHVRFAHHAIRTSTFRLREDAFGTQVFSPTFSCKPSRLMNSAQSGTINPRVAEIGGSASGEVIMSKTNKELAHRWFEEVWNKGRREAIADMLLPDSVIHEGGESTLGPDGFYPFFERMQAAFSDIHITIHDDIAEGDKVCVRWSCRMRHTGPGLGMAASNKQLHTTGISIVRIVNDRLVEGWQNWDMLGLIQQIECQPLARTYIAAGDA